MPQDLALHDDLSIHETLSYFGLINILRKDKLNDRIKYLIKLLNLQNEDQLIKHLSEGEKRRVSFASAIIHEPPLLVLDEPTVGVDPLLRTVIWDVLLNLSRGASTTVIITTHYIEESKRADVIGFMRDGAILATGSPLKLTTYFGTKNLEEVFYKICNLNQTSKRYLDLNTDLDSSNHNEEFSEKSLFSRDLVNPFSTWISKSQIIIKTQFIRMFRQPESMFVCIILPIIIMFLLCYAVGDNPTHLNIAIVNGEETPSLSQLFLEKLNREVIHQISYSSLQKALEDAKARKIWGVLRINGNFTENILQRVLNIGIIDNGTMQQSRISIYGDLCNEYLRAMVERSMEKGFQNFTRDLMGRIGGNPNAGGLPIALGKPIFGGDDLNGARDYLGSGFIVAIVFGVSISMTILDLYAEKLHKMFERNLVAGVSTSQLVMGHLVSRFFLLVIECLILLSMTVYIFNITCKGSFHLALILLVLQSLTSMINGMIIASLVDDMFAIMYIGVAYFLYLFLTSGVFWPFEALPVWMKWFNYYSPLTTSVEAMRNIMVKGLPFLHAKVFPGFIISLIWSFIFYLSTLIAFKNIK